MLNKKAIHYTLIAILSVIFAFSSFMLIKTLYEYKKSKDQFDKLAQLVTITDTDENNSTNTSTPNTTTSNPPSTTLHPITRNVALLNQRNNECVGWVYIKGTKVNYPVMYTPNKPEKYLKRDFYGRIMGSGTPFIDARCDLNSKNIICTKVASCVANKIMVYGIYFNSRYALHATRGKLIANRARAGKEVENSALLKVNKICEDIKQILLCKVCCRTRAEILWRVDCSSAEFTTNYSHITV